MKSLNTFIQESMVTEASATDVKEIISGNKKVSTVKIKGTTWKSSIAFEVLKLSYNDSFKKFAITFKSKTRGEVVEYVKTQNATFTYDENGVACEKECKVPFYYVERTGVNSADLITKEFSTKEEKEKFEKESGYSKPYEDYHKAYERQLFIEQD